MKYISICSGIEAATTAWHGLGWEPLAFSEIEPFPSAVLAHHYPDVPNLGDMSKFREWPEELLVECDLLVGGSPCQAFSVAGLRKSLDDERGNLTLVYVHLFHHINEVRKRHGRSPAIALWENVPGVLSTKDNAFGCFISGLLGVDETIETEDGKWPKAGFLGSETVRVGYRILDAQYFAVAQRRRRVFLVAVPCELVASLGGRACPSEILSLRESVLGNPPTRGEARQAVAGTIAGCSNGGGANGPGRTADDADTLVVSCPQTANTLTRRMHKGINTTVDEGQTPIVTGHPDPAYVGNAKDSLPAAMVPFTKSKRAQSENDDESWVPGEVAPTQNQFDVGDTRATTVVAIQERAICENPNAGPDGAGVRQDGVSYTLESRTVPQAVAFRDPSPTITAKMQGSSGWAPHNEDAHLVGVSASCDVAGTLRSNPSGDGQLAGALSAESGMHQTNYVAFATCTDGDECAISFKPGQSAAARSLGESREVSCTIEGAANGNAGHKVAVASHMQVRRLTPTECCRLQGFPDDHCDITFRKKPAADGPKYRALGNSMAVPCMAWLGFRIALATRQDKTGT